MSTSNYQKQRFSGRQLENLHLNSICHDHDMWCSCGEPLKHTINVIFTYAGPTNFSEPEKQIIRKCLGDTTEEDGAGDPDLGGVTGEELEKLFEQDGDPEDDG